MGSLRKILMSFVLILTFFLSQNAFCFVSTSHQNSEKINKEKTLQQKMSRQEKESKGKRKSKSVSEGNRVNFQKALRKIKNENKNTSAHISLSNVQIFSDIIMEKELEKDWIFGKCAILTNPKTIKNLGISFETNGWINVTKQEYIRKAAENSDLVSEVVGSSVENKIKKYIFCMATYAYVVKAATKTMLNDFGNLKILNFEEIENIAKAALNKVEKSVKQGKTPINRKLKLINLILKKSKCNFAQSIDKIQCANMVLNVTIPPSLTYSGISIFDQNQMGGIDSKFEISKSFSLQKAFEIMKSTDKYREIAQRIERYTEKLKSKGKDYEATMLKKKALDMMIQNKADVDIMRVLQIPN